MIRHLFAWAFGRHCHKALLNLNTTYGARGQIGWVIAACDRYAHHRGMCSGVNSAGDRLYW